MASETSPPVYNPTYLTLKDKFEGVGAEEQKKVLTATLLKHVKDMKEEKLPFFAQRDDPREGPKDSQDALRQAEGKIDIVMRLEGKEKRSYLIGSLTQKKVIWQCMRLNWITCFDYFDSLGKRILF
jgi:hypothetical protein